MALIRRAISVRRSCAAAPHGAHRTYCGNSMNASVKRAEHREMFLNIAATWESLANDRIKTAEGLERIAKLEKTARKSRKPS